MYLSVGINSVPIMIPMNRVSYSISLHSFPFLSFPFSFFPFFTSLFCMSILYHRK